MQIMKTTTILIAGGTGDLGGRIIKALLKRGADVRAIVRSTADDAKVQKLEQQGVKVIRANMLDVSELTQACMGVSCLISALQGLHDVIVNMQSILLDAAIAAGVPRFIPSDFSTDFTKLSDGDNRNFDFRREFYERLNKSSIAATSILNGAFTDMLTGQMPFILFKLKRVLYWGNADQRMDFTTMDDTAAFTASVALDPSTPRILRIAGDQLSARELTVVASDVTGKKFRLFRAGGLGMLGTLIKVVRTVSPGETELYPAWQGMQYMRNMFDGRAKLDPLNNERYPDIKWTSAKELLVAHR
jgi:nucleoside-diphosphate-sugar epimerase